MFMQTASGGEAGVDHRSGGRRHLVSIAGDRPASPAPRSFCRSTAYEDNHTEDLGMTGNQLTNSWFCNLKRLLCRSFWKIAIVATLVTPTHQARAELVISEIMFNPDSSEAAPNDVEWVELFNSGTTTVNISGWSLMDEDGSTDLLPMGSSIAAGEAIVLSSLGTSVDGTAADFHAAWGSGYQAFALNFSGMGGFANSPSATNESLSLVDASMNIMDTVNFDDSSPWPSDSPDGSSIYLLSDSIDTLANDLGSNWAKSVDGVDGAIANMVTDRFGGMDLGSPGYVATAVPEPGSFALLAVMSVAGLLATRRKWWPGAQLALGRFRK